jgi:hypothetical protein
MLDIGGVLRCRIHQHSPGFFWIYILLSDLGIEPGEVMIANETFLSQYLKEDHIGGNWYTRLYAYSVGKSKNKKRRWLTKIPDSSLANLEFYNEGTVVTEEAMKDSEWFEQEIKASIILPIIKERSKIPNSLIYVDEYWKT